MKNSNLCQEETPDYKLMNKGISSLSNAELLSLMIGFSHPDKSLETARGILNKVGNNLTDLSKLHIEDLQQFTTKQKAMILLACLEIGRRRKEQEIPKPVKVHCSLDSYNLLSEIGEYEIEEFWIILLNRANIVLDKIKISQGGTSGTVIDTKIIGRHVINKLAHSVILVHNHPSGNLKPSEADIRITERIKHAMLLFEVNVLDHIIITNGSYYSFADEGII